MLKFFLDSMVNCTNFDFLWTSEFCWIYIYGSEKIIKNAKIYF